MTQKQHKKTKKADAGKEKLIKEYTEALKIIQADFENYIKRTDKEKEQVVKTEKSKLLLKFLKVFDDLERALSFMKESENKQLLTGLESIFKNFSKILEEEGVKSIETIGKKCDPNLHEVMTKKADEKEEGTILEEIQKGYVLHDHILRHSKVIISGGGKKNG